MGKGAAGYCAATAASDEDRKLVGELLACVGMAEEIDERLGALA